MRERETILERYGYLEEVANSDAYLDHNGRLVPWLSMLVEVMESLEVLKLQTEAHFKELFFRVYYIMGSDALLHDFFTEEIVFKFRYACCDFSLEKKRVPGFRNQFTNCREKGTLITVTSDDLSAIKGFKAKRREGISREEFLKKFSRMKMQDDWSVFYGMQDFRFFTSEYPARKDFIKERGRVEIPVKHIQTAEWFSEQVVKDLFK